jgi:hypothetical protein
MRLAFAILLASSLWAQSQSFQLSPGRRISTIFPGGSPMCNNVGEFRFEGTGRALSASVDNAQWLKFAESGLNMTLNTNGSMAVGGIQGGGDGTSIAGVIAMQYIRFRYRRDTANAVYTLEIWNENTGVRTTSTFVDSSPGVVVSMPSCTMYVGSESGTPPSFTLGALRIYSTAGALGAPPPARLLTSGFADLLDLEFEGNLNDSSGRGISSSMSIGSASYTTTVDLDPVVAVTGPTTVRAGGTATLVSDCLSNEDNPTCSLFWQQISSSNGLIGVWANRTSATVAGFTAPVHGEYNLSVTATTATRSAATAYTVGASATDVNGVVIIPDENIAAIIGPIIRSGANQWSWFDDRAITAANIQIDQQTGANGAGTFWNRPWDTNLGGTVSVSFNSATITGTDTQFQTDFCGGAGNTTPATGTDYIYIKYTMAEYPGVQTLARLYITGCPSQTSLTTNVSWGHATGTQSGLSYSKGSPNANTYWTNSTTPGNYYDNVLAFYALYYRTGLTKYRDAARTLARNWWEGPFYGRGKNYDYVNLGGSFIAAGPARGQSITGLILWALESGENIWPGFAYVMGWHKFAGWDFFNSRGWTSANVQIGDLREQAYLLAAYSLYSRFAMSSPGVPDATARSSYRQYVKDYINLLLEPMQFPTGEWRWTSVQNFSVAGGSNSVTVTNGSNAITLNGVTSRGRTWVADDFGTGAGAYQAWVWFFSNRSNSELPGKQNSDLGGDAEYYRVTVAGSGTTATLDRNYTGTSGNKGVIVSSIVGFGNQPFMHGLMVGVIATYTYDAMVFHGDTAEAAKALSMATLGAQWLRGSDAFKSSGHYLYGASLFLNCVAAPDSDGCTGDTVLNGEGMRGPAAVYLLSPSTALLNNGDELYTSVWCKPTGGWTCGTAGYGTYGSYLDDGAFMLDKTSALINKWFGFFFGYGFGSTWPVARAGGIVPKTTTAKPIQARLANISGAVDIVVDYLAADGTVSTSSPCTSAACTFATDARQGYLYRVRYRNGSAATLATGQYLPVN